MGGHGGAIELGNDGGSRFHRLFHVQREMGNHVRLDHELAVGKLLDQDRPQQRRVGRLRSRSAARRASVSADRGARRARAPGAQHARSTALCSECSRARLRRWNRARSLPMPEVQILNQQGIAGRNHVGLAEVSAG